MAKKKVFLQGNEACAEGALAAGVKFFAGYPITPSSEIAEVLSRRLPMVGGKFIQMEDEIASMGAVIGASLAGAKSITATSGPGFSLKQENLGFACITEVPVVVVNVMRGGPSTGLPTCTSQSDVMQARWGTHGDHPIIALVPWSVEESFHLTVRAFNLSEKYRTPVILLLDEVVGHMREAIEIPDPSELEIVNRKKPTCKPEEYLPYDLNNEVNPLPAFGEGYRFHVTGLNHDATGFPTNDSKLVQKDEERLMNKLLNHLDDILTWEEYMTDDMEILVYAYGSTARSAIAAVKQAREEGIKAGLFRPITLWPFPDDKTREMVSKVKKVIVPEVNLGMIIGEVKRVSPKEDINIVGVNRADGETIVPQQILDKIKELS
ncbi:MAG: 2-oxoacid:acceptor oxidoreductase subunit alpha [Candidatus Schekmanbacteria bacterium]|nr:MAG: 2-oxoacid:acceptor oxidoreductase subunit alpha [Candidatus Schekmanbacteria bacterium]